MHVAARVALIGGAAVVGVGGLAYAFSRRSETVREERAVELPFAKFTGYPGFDTNGDGRIDRKTEVVHFSDGDAKTGPSYSSIRAVADGADMIVGNRDGFATPNEFADLARTYTTRPGAIGLNADERSVFAEDWGIRMGDGGSPEEMRGNPYF